MKIDLHTHSYFSDGESSPEQIIVESKNNQVSLLSITDHNTIQYDENIVKIAQKNNINFIEGIEISTLHTFPDSTISLHVLGYSKEFNRKMLSQHLKKTVDGYNSRAQKIVDKLNREFPELHLNFELIKENSHEVYVSRNTLARLLSDHLKTISIKEALKQYVFIEEDDSWMMKTQDSFLLIAKSGGVPVLAHSGRELRRMGTEAYALMISQFVKSGLRGLEIYYPKHTEEEMATMRSIANKYGLYITAGSDWHGNAYTPDVKIGMDCNGKDLAPFIGDVAGVFL